MGTGTLQRRFVRPMQTIFSHATVAPNFFSVGTPMVMSFPHFYDGPKEYVDGVVGLNPEQDKHELIIVMEPVRLSS